MFISASGRPRRGYVEFEIFRVRRSERTVCVKKDQYCVNMRSQYLIANAKAASVIDIYFHTGCVAAERAGNSNCSSVV